MLNQRSNESAIFNHGDVGCHCLLSGLAIMLFSLASYKKNMKTVETDRKESLEIQIRIYQKQDISLSFEHVIRRNLSDKMTTNLFMTRQTKGNLSKTHFRRRRSNFRNSHFHKHNLMDPILLYSKYPFPMSLRDFIHIEDILPAVFFVDMILSKRCHSSSPPTSYLTEEINISFWRHYRVPQIVNVAANWGKSDRDKQISAQRNNAWVERIRPWVSYMFIFSYILEGCVLVISCVFPEYIS